MYDTVRINLYPEDHPNAYAQVDLLNSEQGFVLVSNMNMPYMGTFAGKRFELNEVTFLEPRKPEVDLTEVFDALSDEAKEAVQTMVAYCVNNRKCMGPNEGMLDPYNEIEEKYVSELREFFSA